MPDQARWGPARQQAEGARPKPAPLPLSPLSCCSSCARHRRWDARDPRARSARGHDAPVLSFLSELLGTWDRGPIGLLVKKADAVGKVPIIIITHGTHSSANARQ